VPNVYHHFKDYGCGAIPRPANCDCGVVPVPSSYQGEELSDVAIKLIDEIYRDYGQFSAFKLMEMTHSEPP